MTLAQAIVALLAVPSFGLGLWAAVRASIEAVKAWNDWRARIQLRALELKGENERRDDKREDTAQVRLYAKMEEIAELREENAELRAKLDRVCKIASEHPPKNTKNDDRDTEPNP